MKIAVAATAPFGADVLERLAARHDVTALLTRPDRPAGRGRKVAAPPAKVVAEQLGIPVLQPERPTAELELPAETIVVVAYGLLIPDDLLERGLWLNVHPSLLPRWRGAAPVERALLAGDAETGVTIHETVKELDAGPIAAQRAFLVTPEDDAGTVYERAAELAVELLDEVLPEPVFRPQEGEASYAAKIEPDDRVLDLSRPVESLNRIRALSPHIGARGELHGRPVTIWRARLEDGELVPEEVQPEGGKRMPLRRIRARAALMEVAPARQAAYDVLRRVAEEGAYADRALAVRLGGARRSRPRARTPACVRLGAAHAHARSRDRDAREAPGAEARPAGACGAAPRRVPARLPRRRPALRRGERVGRARAPRGSRTGRAVHERGPAASLRGNRAAPGRRCPRGLSSTPIRTGSGTSGAATSGRRRRWR